MTSRHREFKSTCTMKTSTLIAILIAICINASCASHDNLNVPCKFRDSINITDGYLDSDSNIVFDDIVYTSNHYGVFDYEFINETFRQPAAPHYRGCICQLKPCVRLCCGRGSTFRNGSCVDHPNLLNLKIELSDDMGNKNNESLFDVFGYTIGKPCSTVIELTPDIYPDDAWTMSYVSFEY